MYIFLVFIYQCQLVDVKKNKLSVADGQTNGIACVTSSVSVSCNCITFCIVTLALINVNLCSVLSRSVNVQKS